MSETIKMSTINVEGKKIVKNIPKDLYSNYLNMGWKVETEKAGKPAFTYTKKEVKNEEE